MTLSVGFEERRERYLRVLPDRPWRQYVTARQGRRLRQKAWKHGELPRERPFRSGRGWQP